MKDFEYQSSESSEEDVIDYIEEGGNRRNLKYAKCKKAFKKESFFSFQGTSLSKPPPTSILPSSPSQRFSTTLENSTDIIDQPSLNDLAPLNLSTSFSRGHRSKVPTPKYSDWELGGEISDEKESSFLTPEIYQSGHLSNLIPINDSFSEQLTTHDILSRSAKCIVFSFLLVAMSKIPCVNYQPYSSILDSVADISLREKCE